MRVFERITNISRGEVESHHQHCQAAINSDGKITLRCYSSGHDEEKMLILSQTETNAIFELFRILKNENSLPF